MKHEGYPNIEKYWPMVVSAYDRGEYHKLMGPHLRRFWHEITKAVKSSMNTKFNSMVAETREAWKTMMKSKFGVSESFFKDRTPDEVVTAIEIRALEKMQRIQHGDIPEFMIMIRKGLTELYRHKLANPEAIEIPF